MGHKRSLKRHRATAAARLPDDLLEDILQRLPAKSVLRFRAVSTSWCRLLSDPAFLRARDQRAPRAAVLRRPAPHQTEPRDRNEIIDYDPEAHRDVSDAIYSLPLDRFGRPSAEAALQCGESDEPAVILHGCFDGLLLLSRPGPPESGYYVYNPATREHASVPAASGKYFVAGFYLHVPSAEYRVLCYSRTRTGWVLQSIPGYYQVSFTYFVAAASRLGTRRVAGDVHPQWYHNSRVPPVMVRGCLHWLSEPTILVFDTVAEEFRRIRAPMDLCGPIAMHRYRRATRLVRIQGTLGKSCFEEDEGVIKLSVLQDYDDETSWTCMYRISVDILGGDKLAREWGFCIVHVGDEGDALLVGYDSKWCGVYNLQRGEVVSAARELGGGLRATSLVYKESFASPAPKGVGAPAAPLSTRGGPHA